MESVTGRLEKRVTVLEQQLRKVRSELKAVRTASQRPWWERLSGKFKNDPLFAEITKAGQAYRRSLTPRTR